mmetsp:Transcript_10981/g.46134  ORF Transcript_10981/g.46134 Transcript_10981/m.46134 type:complete len:298 (+) Transcript_10981:118-1011(+)
MPHERRARAFLGARQTAGFRGGLRVLRASGDHGAPELRVRAVPRGDAMLRAAAAVLRRAGNRPEGRRKLGKIVRVERARVRRTGPAGGSEGAFLGRIQRKRARALLEHISRGGRRSHGRLARVRVAGSRDRALQGFRVGVSRRVERIHHRRAFARCRAVCRVPPAREVAETAPDVLRRREFGMLRVPRLVRLPAQEVRRPVVSVRHRVRMRVPQSLEHREQHQARDTAERREVGLAHATSAAAIGTHRAHKAARAPSELDPSRKNRRRRFIGVSESSEFRERRVVFEQSVSTPRVLF